MQRGDADVIEEEQGIAAGGEDVVHAHGDEILACGFEQIVLQQQFQLGPDAVATGHHDRLLVAAEIVTSGEKPEGAQQLAFAFGAAAEFADVTDEFGGSFGINTRFFVG